MIARTITGLPKWTPIKRLVKEADMPPLDLVLDNASQLYGTRVLLSPDNHPCIEQLLQLLQSNKSPTYGTGLRRISDKMRLIIKDVGQLEHTEHHGLEPIATPTIAKRDKNTEVKAHIK